MASNPTAGIAYADSERARVAYLERLARVESDAAARMRQEYAVAMRRVEERLTAALERAGALIEQGASPLAAMTQATMLDQQRQFIRSEMQRFGESAAGPFADSVNAATDLGITHAMQQLSGVTANVFAPNRQTIMQMAARTAPGTALRDHVYQMGDRVGEQITSDLLSGAMLGENPRVIASRIRSTLDSVVPHLNTLVRTETLGAARQGQLDTYGANSDVVTGWIWDAAQDRRTCAVCWAQNGTEHELREPFASHPNCRCTPLPRLKTYDEILGTSGKFKDDGPKPFSGDDVFRKQPANVQLAVLGPSKYAAYASGKLPTISRLVGQTHHRKWGPGLRERTLGELGLPRVLATNLRGSIGMDMRIARAARLRVARARRDEPAITRALRSSVKVTDGKLTGLEYRVKEVDSLSRKIKTEINDFASGDPPIMIGIDTAVAKMADVNRYTVILPPGSYVHGVTQMVEQLGARGYTFPIDRWKNTWEPGKPYRGLNTTMVGPDGTRIEVQFHTQQSFDTKMASHEPYEEARKDTTTPERRKQLNEEMAAAAAAIDPPTGWKRIMQPPARLRQG